MPSHSNANIHNSPLVLGGGVGISTGRVGELQYGMSWHDYTMQEYGCIAFHYHSSPWYLVLKDSQCAGIHKIPSHSNPNIHNSVIVLGRGGVESSTGRVYVIQYKNIWLDHALHFTSTGLPDIWCWEIHNVLTYTRYHHALALTYTTV